MIILFIVISPQRVYAEEEYQTLLEDYASIYGEQIQDSVADTEIESVVPGFDADRILLEIATGKYDFDLNAIINKGIKILLGEVYSSLKIMVLVLALSILCSYLINMRSAFGSEGVEQVAYFACYIMIVGIASAAFFDVISCAKSTIENAALFMRLIVPVVLASLIGVGAIVSAAVIEPTLLLIIEISVTVIIKVFLPIIMISTAVSIVGCMSDKIKTDRLTKFLNQVIKWGLSCMMIIFVSVVGFKSIAAGGADGISLKIAKFATSNIIPVVGGILAETVETVMNCSLAIKNAVGLTCGLVIVLIVVTPLLKIIASLIIFRTTAAILEPIADSKITKCLSGLADSVSVVFSFLSTVSVMFIIILTIVINAGNSAIMLGR